MVTFSFAIFVMAGVLAHRVIKDADAAVSSRIKHMIDPDSYINEVEQTYPDWIWGVLQGGHIVKPVTE
jgi:hypothetical protein